MEEDSVSINLTQPTLFDFTESTSGAVELFPAVWSAVEGLAAPEPAARHSALDRLIELGAPRLSPLVAYVLATRLADPDISVRVRIIRVLGEALRPDEYGRTIPGRVNRYLVDYLSQMRTRPIFALMEAVDHAPEIEPHAARLINNCPYAGGHLSAILADRKNPLGVRRQAAHFIGLVGFLDATPALERLETRLATRLHGQRSMPFAPPSASDEVELLPAVQKALGVLRSG